MALKTALIIDGSSDGARQALAQVEQAMESAEREAKTLAASANVASQSLERQTAIAGSTRMGFQQLSYQIGDVAQQYALGVNPMVIFAQQSGQVVQAVQLMGSSAGGLASFLGGPWGIAISTAVVALAPFIGKLFDTKDALDAVGYSAESTMAKLDELAKKKGQVDAIALADAKLGVIIQEGRLRTLEQQRGRQTAAQRAFNYRPNDSGEVTDIQRAFGMRESGVAQARADLAAMKSEVAAIEMQIRNRQRYEAGGRTGGSGGAGGSSRVGGGSSRSASRPGGQSEAEQARKALELENQRYAAAAQRLILERQLTALRGTGLAQDAKRADIMAADFQIEQQFPQLAASTNKADQDRLAALKAIAEAAVTEAYARKDAAAAAREQAELGDLFDKIAKESAQAVKREQEEAFRREQQQIRTLSALFEDGLKGGTKAVWKDFEHIGSAVVANIAAQFALSLFPGGEKFNLTSAVGNAIGSILPGFGGGRASGGPVSPGSFYAVNERSTAPGLFFPLAAGVIQPPGNDNGGGARAGTVTVRLELSDDLDGRIQQVSGPVAVEVVRATAPAIRDAAVAETARLMTRPGV